MEEKKIISWGDILYYKITDFNSPDIKSGGELMDLDLIYFLDTFETIYQHHLVITSAYRSLAHNLKAGGVSNSAHTKGKAIDVGCNVSMIRFKLIKHALDHNIKRIGIAKTFLHFDNDGTLPNPVMWLYK